MPLINRCVLLLVVVGFLFCTPVVQAAIPKKAFNALVQEIATQHDLNPEWVANQLRKTTIQPLSIRLMRPAVSRPKNWQAYRSRLVTPERIQAGAMFWEKHQAALERAEQIFGVPAEIIVGILGVETMYGQNMGDFRVLDALATLAFHFPEAHPRAAQRMRYFRSELGAMLALAYHARQDPFDYWGSYAGAMGKAQFMPSSWQKYAVDFDEDGDASIDLFTSGADAIGSIAHYLAQHHWQKNLPTHYPVVVRSTEQALRQLLAPDILPSFTFEDFTSKGVRLQDSRIKPQGLLALVALHNHPDGAPEYFAGTQNFYALTRYNRSSYYAKAVIDLGAAIKAQIVQTQ